MPLWDAYVWRFAHLAHNFDFSETCKYIVRDILLLRQFHLLRKVFSLNPVGVRSRIEVMLACLALPASAC